MFDPDFHFRHEMCQERVHSASTWRVRAATYDRRFAALPVCRGRFIGQRSFTGTGKASHPYRLFPDARGRAIRDPR